MVKEGPSAHLWRAAQNVIRTAREARNCLEHEGDHVARPERCYGCKIEGHLDKTLADFDRAMGK